MGGEKHWGDRETVLITGATSGIGYELCRRFAANGHNLVIVARDARRLAEIGAQFEESYGISAMGIAADLAEPGAPRQIFDDLQRRNIPVNILVNNAGFNEYGPFADTSLQRELEMIQLHIAAITSLTKLFLPAMLQRRHGGILNVGSTGSFAPVPLNAVYCATKAYILNFTEALAGELRGSGIKVTALCPGATATEFAARANMEGTRIFQGRLMDAAAVAAAGYEALQENRGVVIPGIMNQATVTSIRFAPRRLVAMVGRWMLEQKPGH